MAVEDSELRTSRSYKVKASDGSFFKNSVLGMAKLKEQDD